VGDTTPNTLGAFCESPGQTYDGLACDFNSSTCGGRTQDCHGRGPGFAQDALGFASNAIIGRAQFDGARAIMGGSRAPVQGPVASVHVYMNMFVPRSHASSRRRLTHRTQVIPPVHAREREHSADVPARARVQLRGGDDGRAGRVRLYSR
jgi:hypothetical protein